MSAVGQERSFSILSVERLLSGVWRTLAVIGFENTAPSKLSRLVGRPIALGRGAERTAKIVLWAPALYGHFLNLGPWPQ